MNAPQKSLQMRAMETARRIGNVFGFGLQFNGARDLAATYGYPRQVQFAHCWEKYKRQDIASRIINTPADAIWTDPPTIKNLSSFEEKFKAIDKKFDVWQVFNRADKLAGMGDYAGIVVGLDDGSDLQFPIANRKNREIIYLQPYSCEALMVEELEDSPLSPRFGRPKMYQLRAELTTNSGGTGMVKSVRKTMRIHHSRVVHIADNPLESEITGVNRLQRTYNLLEDLLKVGGGSAEIYWLNSRGGMQIDVDKEMSMSAEDATALGDEVSEYVNDLRRVIRTRGTKINMLNAELADPLATFKVLIALVSAATGIPQRIMIGAEAGQLASEQDRASWAVVVTERRKNFAQPCVLKPFFLKMADLNYLTEEEVYNLEYEWPEAFKLSPLERSQTSAQQARSASNLSKTMIQTPELVGIEEARNIIAGMAPQQTMVPSKLPSKSEQISQETFDAANPPPALGGFGAAAGTTKPPKEEKEEEEEK